MQVLAFSGAAGAGRRVLPIEVRRIEMAVMEHEALFLEKWHEHTGR
jgi:hypothetical protein